MFKLDIGYDLGISYTSNMVSFGLKGQKSTFVKPLSVKKALSVKIIGPLSPKAIKCKKFGRPLSIIALICKNDLGSNVLVQAWALVDRGHVPLLFEVEGTPCVLSPLLYWE